MDAAALILDDVRIENVMAMIEYNLEHGVYSQLSNSAMPLDEIKRCDRPKPESHSFLETTKKPGNVSTPGIFLSVGKSQMVVEVLQI